MADLAVAAVLGPVHRNSGRPRYADVVAHLYVGGSGVWQFHLLGRPDSQESVVRLRSSGQLAIELAAGFALSTEVAPAVGLVEERLGPGWSKREIDLDVPTVRRLAREVADLDVAALVALFGPDPDEVDELVQMPWSVVVATPTAGALRTQWD